jgi:hypothetical protein
MTVHTVLIVLLVLYLTGTYGCRCAAPRISRRERRQFSEHMDYLIEQARQAERAGQIYRPKPAPPPPPATLGEIVSVLVACLPLIVVVSGMIVRFLMRA